MICVIATIEVAVGCRDELLQLLGQVAPRVRAEAGCIEYAPLVDLPDTLPNQDPPCPNAVVLVEKWESLDALKAHLQTLHMAEFFLAAERMQMSVRLRLRKPA